MFLYKFYNKLLHAPNKMIYPLSSEIQIDSEFKKKGYKKSKVEEIHKSFLKNLSKNIQKNIDLDILRKEIIKRSTNNFNCNIFDLINCKDRDDLKKYYGSKNKIDIASSLLGTKCKLRNILINYNFYNHKTTEQEGSKMWHRDSDSLSDQLKIFIPLTPVTFESGMFYFISNEDVPCYKKFKLDMKKINNKDISIWNKFRTEDEKIIDYLKDISKIKYFSGNLGDIIYIDTSRVYHKGGYIRDENSLRLMLQVTYSPILTFTSWNVKQNKFSNFLKNKLTNLKIRLQEDI